MAVSDSCLRCQRPEHEHTEEELRVCWEVIKLEADFSMPQADGPPCSWCGKPTDAVGGCTGSCDPADEGDY